MRPVAIRQLDTSDAGFDAALQGVLQLSVEADTAIDERVAAILDDVRRRGDAAVLEHTARLDGLHAPDVRALEVLGGGRILEVAGGRRTLEVQG